MSLDWMFLMELQRQRRFAIIAAVARMVRVILPLLSFLLCGQVIGQRVGSFNISNFDGANYSGTVSGTPGSTSYSGSLSGIGRAGSVNGGFFGNAAADTGGSFSVRSAASPSYIVNGVFGGHQ